MAMAFSTSRSIIKLRLVGGDRVLVPSFSSSAAAISSVVNDPGPTSSQPQGKEDVRGLGWSRWLLFLPGAITFGLGTWQIFRRQDKIKMLEYRQMRLDMEPIKFAGASVRTDTADNLEFRKVMCTGVFDNSKSIYIGPRSRSISGVTENGYYVITPLVPVPGNPESIQSPILVNRGWVPRSWKEDFFKASQHDQQPADQAPSLEHKSAERSRWSFWFNKSKKTEVQFPSVTCVDVVGVIRGSENPSIFVPQNDPSSRQWFYVDVPAIARACGLPENTIYVEDVNEKVNPSNPYPLPKDVNALIQSSVMPQQHLHYTLTWYSLSAAVSYMAFKRIRQRKGRR